MYIYVYVCMYNYNVLFNNFTIKPHTKNILTKHNKLLFFNHNFNRSFNQTQETAFFLNYNFNHSFYQTPTFFEINLTESTLY